MVMSFCSMPGSSPYNSYALSTSVTSKRGVNVRGLCWRGAHCFCCGWSSSDKSWKKLASGARYAGLKKGILLLDVVLVVIKLWS